MCHRTPSGGRNDGFTTNVEMNIIGVRTLLVKTKYLRVNSDGYGATRCRLPCEVLTIDGKVALEALNGADELSKELRVKTYNDTVIDNIIAQLVDGQSFTSSVKGGAQEIQIAGYLHDYATDYLLSNAKAESTGLWCTTEICDYARLKANTNGAAFVNNTLSRRKQNILIALVREAGEEYTNLTWYQLQYAILQTAAPYYVDNDTARAWIEQYPALAAIAGSDTT